MSDDFALEETRRLFRRPSRAMKIRQLLYSSAKAVDGSIVLSEFVADHKEEFRSGEIYRAAKVLVTHGIMTRSDVNYGEIVNGKERTRYRYAIRYLEPFTSASRKW